MTTAARTVAFAMNYPADEAHRLWAEGRYPGFHLMGCATLEASGYDVSYLPLGREHPRTSAGRSIRFFFGARLPQLRALRSGAAVAYAGDPATFATLAHLRGLGLLRRPVVAFVHPNVARHPLFVRALRGYDVLVTPSRVLHSELVEDLGLPAARSLLAPFGPDLSWGGYAPVPGEAVVSSGKTHRDEATLLAALGTADSPARVHTRDFQGVRRVGCVERVGSASYPEVLADLCAAGLVAIPLVRTDGTFGVSELNDALALGKPVIMTRNPYIDVDVEAIGCGVTVAAGDLDGWQRALHRLGQPDVRDEAGARGRAFAETSWNAQLFGEVVRQAIDLAGGW